MDIKEHKSMTELEGSKGHK